MKYVLSISFLIGSVALVACGDSGGDDGSTVIAGEKFGCTINGGCVETEVPEGGDKAAGEKTCTDFSGTVSPTCAGEKIGCCDTSAGIRQCYYGVVSAEDAEKGCEGDQDGTWNPA